MRNKSDVGSRKSERRPQRADRRVRPGVVCSAMLVLWAAGVSVAPAIAAEVPPATVEAERPIWSTDLMAALDEQPARPMVLLFSTSTCHWCTVLKQDAATSAELRQVLAQTAAIEISGEERPDLAARLGVRGYPTLILVNRRRELVRMVGGYQAPGDLAVMVRVLILRGDETKAEAIAFAGPPPAATLLASDDPEAAIATALDRADPAARRHLRDELGAAPAALPALWRLLDHARPGVRTDAAAALAATAGEPPDYDPLAPATERGPAIARWQAAAERRRK